MKQLVNITLPSTYYPSIFYSSNNIEFEYNNQLSDVLQSPFIYDLLDQFESNHYKPWESREESLPFILKEWEKDRQKLTDLFSARKRKEAKPIALNCISLFFMAVYWTNEKSVQSVNQLEEPITNLKIKPVNCVERLTYILNAPDHYHSFIQLTQLFDELNKQFHKSIFMQKK
ncbi:YpoC family protein [Bacillus suaedaesalsae]|uniref:YpoC-like domain-containing protein n=1 Tax=Bacillus suaedaesalsae TaxID=2810349 RepID=A0ABS2DMU1_9BACI|nr:hypothetical protein [Bacillus suaedaesalsae]MBM6619822.1 hypothetical protein [Bacillus suaedaesalsae]